MNGNYQKEYEKEIELINNNFSGTKPKLLLHACCAPCSSHVLTCISDTFDITLFFYNPNIFPEDEFELRFNELKRLVNEMGLEDIVKTECPKYNCDEFFDVAKGLENVREGGERCFRCYRLRLEKTAVMAKEKGYDYFATTLSISPLKNAAKLNETGEELSLKYNVKYLVSDFKKKDGYKHSIELSKKYNLYRQNFCGCVFSKNQAKDDGRI